MKVKIRGALFHCGRCRKSYSNPLGHSCVSRTDFRQRSARAKKEAAAAKRKARPEHPRFSACRDEDCNRIGCVAYREGFAAGEASGYQAGYAAGVAAGG